MEKTHSQCLLLNADYSLLSVIDWKKALIWYIKHQHSHKYGIDIIDFYKNDYINGTNNKKYPIPCVAKTKRYFRQHNNSVNFSRKNIFIRDGFTCQYCGEYFSSNELTYDHVIPKSLWDYSSGSPTCWTNIVTACISCNRKKGNRTPKQANMQLLTLPNKPCRTQKYLPVTQHLLKINDSMPKEWLIYLPKSYA